MLIKDTFSLIKGVKNYFTMSKDELDKLKVESGDRRLFYVLGMSKNSISHYTKDRIFKLLSNTREREKRIAVINYPEYIFPVSYNKNTDSMILNLAAFNVKEITTKPSPQNLYACLVYGIVLGDIISGRQAINFRFSKSFVDYLTAILLRSFGKKYGLLGSFVNKIAMLKYIVCCYVLASFMGVEQSELFKKAAYIIPFDYKKLETQLSTYNFSIIDEFLRCLSELQVFPNMNKHLFVSEMMKKFHQIGFIPALEDIARFVAIIATSEVKGTEIVPTFLEKYNSDAFGNIIEISKAIFKR